MTILSRLWEEKSFRQNCWNHLKKILTHKAWVFYYCSQAGLVWRGITHDLSKLSPTEFFESAEYYCGISSPINACKADKGYSLAWQHHKGRNTHHYEYWIDHLDDGGIPIKMPLKDVQELICDYLGAAHAYEGKDFTYKGEYKWWLKKAKTAKIHEETKEYITQVLKQLADNQDLKRSMDYASVMCNYWE